MSPDLVGVLVESGIKVVECYSERFCRQLRNAGSLKGDIVDPLEGAYQVARGRIIVEGIPEGWTGALKIIDKLLGDIDLFIVFHDLRRRGRKVRRGLRPRTLIVEYSKNRSLEVLVLSEGVRTSIRKLVEWSRASVRDGFYPVIAVVDDYGIITYYEARASTILQ